MLKISFITIHPKLIENYREFGVMHAVEKKGLASVDVINLRDYAHDRHSSVDDRPYGGGDGMVLRADVLSRALNDQKIGRPQCVINCSPTAKNFRQADALELMSLQQDLVFVCGRFGGIDQRFLDRYVDREYSCGEFVVSGGELPSLMMADATLRLIPGALGHPDSAHFDSFAPGLDGRLESPLYTRPRVFEGLEVPDVLVSGNHKGIESWRLKESINRSHKPPS